MYVELHPRTPSVKVREALVQARHGTTPTGRGITVADRAAMLLPIEIPCSTICRRRVHH